jgi:hypothetical protein
MPARAMLTIFWRLMAFRRTCIWVSIDVPLSVGYPTKQSIKTATSIIGSLAPIDSRAEGAQFDAAKSTWIESPIPLRSWGKRPLDCSLVRRAHFYSVDSIGRPQNPSFQVIQKTATIQVGFAGINDRR